MQGGDDNLTASKREMRAASPKSFERPISSGKPDNVTLTTKPSLTRIFRVDFIQTIAVCVSLGRAGFHVAGGIT